MPQNLTFAAAKRLVKNCVKIAVKKFWELSGFVS